jgi:hypothetical protein
MSQVHHFFLIFTFSPKITYSSKLDSLSFRTWSSFISMNYWTNYGCGGYLVFGHLRPLQIFFICENVNSEKFMTSIFVQGCYPFQFMKPLTPSTSYDLLMKIDLVCISYNLYPFILSLYARKRHCMFKLLPNFFLFFCGTWLFTSFPI